EADPPQGSQEPLQAPAQGEGRCGGGEQPAGQGEEPQAGGQHQPPFQAGAAGPEGAEGEPRLSRCEKGVEEEGDQKEEGYRAEGPAEAPPRHPAGGGSEGEQQRARGQAGGGARLAKGDQEEEQGQQLGPG